MKARLFPLALLVLLESLLVTSDVSAGSSIFRETSLNSGGIVFEINSDPQGNVLVTDYYAGEIRQIDPAASTQTIFSGLAGAGDARGDEAGNVWFSDINVGTVGRIDGNNQLMTWTLPVWAPQFAAAPLGVAVESPTRIWFSDVSGPRVYRLDLSVTSNNICRYMYDGGTSGSYIHYAAGSAWVSDIELDAIVKIDPTLPEVTQWLLPVGTVPDAVTTDSLGNIWFSVQGIDVSASSRASIRKSAVRSESRVRPLRFVARSSSNTPAIARLAPDVASPGLIEFIDPLGASPRIVVPSGNLIWYTATKSDTAESYVTNFAPDVVAGTPKDVSVMPAAAPTVDCATVTPSGPNPVTTASPTLTWTQQTYTQTSSSQGHSITQIPGNGDAWGLTIRTGRFWVGDQGRQVLVAPPAMSSAVFLPLILR